MLQLRPESRAAATWLSRGLATPRVQLRTEVTGWLPVRERPILCYDIDVNLRILESLIGGALPKGGPVEDIWPMLSPAGLDAFFPEHAISSTPYGMPAPISPASNQKRTGARARIGDNEWCAGIAAVMLQILRSDFKAGFAAAPGLGHAMGHAEQLPREIQHYCLVEPVRFLVCRGHETITEITSNDRNNSDQEEQEPEGAEAVPR